MDFHWTLAGLAAESSHVQRIPMDCLLSPLEMAGSDESPSESVGQAVGV